MVISRASTGSEDRSCTGASRLRKLVKRHRVYWVVRPEHLPNEKKQIVEVGFRLTMWGTHDHPKRSARSGCTECVEVYRHLKEIARRVLPVERRDSFYLIRDVDRAGSQPPLGGRRGAEVTLRILHLRGFDQPIDGREEQFLPEIEHRLNKLGAQKGRWRESRAPRS